MSAGAPSYRVLAVRYAERETTYVDAYYRWPSYGEPDGPLAMSYYFWVLVPLHDPGAPPIVVDCGFDPERGARMGRRCLCTPADALDRLGVDPAAVELLPVSHIHYDHVGNLQLFANARLPVARAEFEFWTADPVAQREQFAGHADPEGIERLRRAAIQGRLQLIDDRAELAPGLTAIRVGGHAPGQLIFEVAGEHGPVVLASDAIHYYEELRRRRPFAVFADLADMYRAYERLTGYADAGALVVPGHDPLVMDRFPRVDGEAADLAVCVTDSRSST
ncbi:MAG: N-acyl homoserine lactonase family protein [Solirubrobacterales bacterium]|nr:N-acyl homoserine lactonase family protein [Solirubrobacterales bacterium]MBV9714029.1 N-acyl homoserine lactonase family protein [Solirubrobacterales bacterium]